MVWSVCAVVNEHGRKKIDHFLRSKLNEYPIGDSVYHYYVDPVAGYFRHWDLFLRDENWTYKSEYGPFARDKKCTFRADCKRYRLGFLVYRSSK
jgi:hypothetical protein